MRFLNIKLAVPSTLLFMGVLGLLTSCDEAISLGSTNSNTGIEKVYTNQVALLDLESNSAKKEIALFEDNEVSIRLSFDKSVDKQTTFTITADSEAIDTYNEVNGTDYEMLPGANYTLDNSGVVTYNPSDSGQPTLSLDIVYDGLTVGNNYAIALKISDCDNDEMSIDMSNNSTLYLLKCYDDAENCFKGDDLPKGFVYMYGADNILNALNFKLENGKLLWDVVAFFAAAMQYDDQTTDRLLTEYSPEFLYIMNNREKFIKPLQDRGIKVIMTLLPYWDESAPAQLSETGAKAYAREIAQMCETYGLDGVCFDDEYRLDPPLDNPLFAARSYEAAGRLMYEVKQAMPDKIVSAFVWGYMYGAWGEGETYCKIDGTDISEFCDIALANYGTYSTPLGNMTAKNCSYSSTEYFYQYAYNSLNPARAQAMLDNGYGWFMGFALGPSTMDYAWSTITGAGTLYGSELAPITEYYPTMYDTEPVPYVK